LKPFGPQDYLHTFPDNNLSISLRGVALIKLDAGAEFYSIKTTTSYSRSFDHTLKKCSFELTHIQMTFF